MSYFLLKMFCTLSTTIPHFQKKGWILLSLGMDSGRSRCSKMVTSNQAFPYASTQKFEFLQLLKNFYIPKYSCWLNVPLPQVEYTQIFGSFRVQQPESLITIFKEFFSSHSITLLLAQRSIAAGWVSSAVSHTVIELSYWRSLAIL